MLHYTKFHSTIIGVQAEFLAKRLLSIFLDRAGLPTGHAILIPVLFEADTGRRSQLLHL